MEVENQCVDTHGQSEVGFAFCHLLGFALLPRLKNLKKQRLYRPEKGEPEKYSNLQPILTRPLHWELIEQQYDEFIKIATALRLGTAGRIDSRRFTKNNVQHPTCKALCELGKALKTIFLADYLRLEVVAHAIDLGRFGAKAAHFPLASGQKTMRWTPPSSPQKTLPDEFIDAPSALLATGLTQLPAGKSKPIWQVDEPHCVHTSAPPAV
jgi:Tn3 transposase DDE domain